MPQLDVSFVVLDPMLCDTFALVRRTETMDGNGRPVITSTVIQNQLGVITPEDPSDLQRDDDSAQVARVINLVTKVAVRGVSVGYQPDLISWAGTDYLVTSVKPFSRYGAGFSEVVAKSMNATDIPQ